MKRLYYLDNLMIFLSILVVLHHVSISYGTMGGWSYITSEKLTGTIQVFLSALTGIEASFSMSLFFFNWTEYMPFWKIPYIGTIKQ